MRTSEQDGNIAECITHTSYVFQRSDGRAGASVTRGCGPETGEHAQTKEARRPQAEPQQDAASHRTKEHFL